MLRHQKRTEEVGEMDGWNLWIYLGLVQSDGRRNGQRCIAHSLALVHSVYFFYYPIQFFSVATLGFCRTNNYEA